LSKNGVVDIRSRELLKEVCREIVSLVPSDRISLALPTDDGERYVVVTVHPEGEGAPTWEVQREGSCAAHVLKRRKAEFFPNLGTEFRYPEEEALHHQGIRDAAFLPLLLGADPFGVLILGAKEPRSLEGKGVRFLERASGILATAMAATHWERPAILSATADHSAPPGASRPTTLQRAYRQMVAFSRVSSAIVQEDDLNVACRMFLDAIRGHSGYERAVMTLLDAQGRDYQWFFTGLSDDDIDYFHGHKMSPAQRSTVLQDRYRTGNSFCVPASCGVDFGLRRSPQAPADLLFVPLHGARGSLVGTLMLDDPQEPLPPTAEVLSSLELFANQMAHAVEKKRLDQEVQSAQARLRAAQEQLMQMEKMSAIGQLISGVTHELNNPLSGIMGFAQLVMATEINPKARKNLERIYNEAVRCHKIVQNLLGFSRRHKPETTYGDLNAAIDGVLELRAYQFQVDNLEIERRFDPDLPRTMFDVHQVQQVILNVINNAHQAMVEAADRPRRLVVTTERDGEILRARFADSGPGIPRERLEKIFDPFFTTKAQGRGTGLGLSLSRAIVKEHRGALKASSTLGEGTTITIELPLLGEGQIAPEEPASEGPAGPFLPLRLLVVDDEEVLVELLTDFLRSCGHRVDAAHDGRKALEMAGSGTYDVILTDLKMPGLDGQGLYEQVTRVHPEMAQRFIFSTGDLASSKTQTFFQTTGCLYLSKPFKLESVLRLLEQLARRLKAA
jgi:signal transduction histidine kinase